MEPTEDERQDAASAADDHSIEGLLERLDRAEARVKELEEDHLRVHADIDNQRRRMARESEQARRYANERLIGELLPACDSLERGLATDASLEQQREGMQITLRMVMKALEGGGLSPIDPVGEVFNPEFHEVMSMQPSEEHAPGTVIATLQRGYRLNERLVRPALVIVARAADS